MMDAPVGGGSPILLSGGAQKTQRCEARAGRPAAKAPKTVARFDRRLAKSLRGDQIGRLAVDALGLGRGAERPGAVVNVASIAGLGATGSIGWYAVSKAASIHLTVELGYQLGPDVRVNAVAPAVVKTRFAEALVFRFGGFPVRQA